MNSSAAFIFGPIVAWCVCVLGVALFAVHRQAPSRVAPASVDPAPPARRVDVSYITSYPFPSGMLDRALVRCPRTASREEVEQGLRQFLIAAGEAALAGHGAGMPSTTVDEAWHEFMIYTRSYAAFCFRAFGRFLHHEPEVTMSGQQVEENQTTAMARTWDSACRTEHLDERRTTKAPALFRSDVTAGVSGSTRYLAACGSTTSDCRARKRTVCVAHHLRVGDPTVPVSTVPSTRDRRSLATNAASSSTAAGSGEPDWRTPSFLAGSTSSEPAHPGSHDAGSHDAGSHDAGSHDAGSHDAGSHDAGSHDAGSHVSSQAGCASSGCGSSTSSCGSSTSSCGSSGCASS